MMGPRNLSNDGQMHGEVVKASLVNARRIFKKKFKTALTVKVITIISMWYNQEDWKGKPPWYN